PGPRLHDEHADPLAFGSAAVAVRHVHADAFLATNDRANAGRGQRVNQRVLGETEERIYAFALESLGDRLRPLHRAAPTAMAASPIASSIERPVGAKRPTERTR